MLDLEASLLALIMTQISLVGLYSKMLGTICKSVPPGVNSHGPDILLQTSKGRVLMQASMRYLGSDSKYTMLAYQ